MNQRDEQRVIDALQAFTGGLTVTENDMLIAGRNLKDNLEPPRPRRRLAMVAVAAAAALVVGFVIFEVVNADNDPDAIEPAQTQTPAEVLTSALEPHAYSVPVDESGAGTPQTVEHLAGFWLLRPYLDVTLPMLVTGNGTYSFGADGITGTSTLSGNTWVRRLGPHAGCPRTQSFTTAIAADGSLRAQVAPADNTCTVTDGLEVWDPVAPGSPVADYLRAMTGEANWRDTPVPSGQHGVYVAPSTGHVLVVTDKGRYRYYDSLTADELVAADRGELESDAGTVSGSCTGGSFSGRLETAPIPGVDGLLAGSTAIRITADTDTCASNVAAEGVWVRAAERY
jgi:hypothetical protein